MPSAFAKNPVGHRLSLVVSLSGGIFAGISFAISFVPLDLDGKLRGTIATFGTFFTGIAVFISAGATWMVKKK